MQVNRKIATDGARLEFSFSQSTSRLLSKASTLVWSASLLEELISGCVLDHQGNIIVTHLDVDTTRWVSNFIFANPSRSISEVVVYLRESQVIALQEQKREFFRAKHEFTDQMEQHYGQNEKRSQSAEETIPVRLLFLHRARVTICMLALMQVQSFNAFHRLESLNNEINSFEAAVARVVMPMNDASIANSSGIMNSSGGIASSAMGPLSPVGGGQHNLSPSSAAASDSLHMASSSHAALASSAPNFTSVMHSPIRSSAGSSPSSSTPATPPPTHFSPAASGSLNTHIASPVLAVSVRTVSRGLPASPRGVESGNGFHAPLRTSSTSGGLPLAHLGSSSSGAKSQAYNYLSFSEETHTQEGNVGIRKPDAEKVFFESLSFVHDTFNETPQITKVVYRDHQGTLFCRKLFGKETYFHQLVGGHQTKFAHFEERAREQLSAEHSVFLI